MDGEFIVVCLFVVVVVHLSLWVSFVLVWYWLSCYCLVCLHISRVRFRVMCIFRVSVYVGLAATMILISVCALDWLYLLHCVFPCWDHIPVELGLTMFSSQCTLPSISLVAPRSGVASQGCPGPRRDRAQWPSIAYLVFSATTGVELRPQQQSKPEIRLCTKHERVPPNLYSVMTSKKSRTL